MLRRSSNSFPIKTMPWGNIFLPFFLALITCKSYWHWMLALSFINLLKRNHFNTNVNICFEFWSLFIFIAILHSKMNRWLPWMIETVWWCIFQFYNCNMCQWCWKWWKYQNCQLYCIQVRQQANYDLLYSVLVNYDDGNTIE